MGKLWYRYINTVIYICIYYMFVYIIKYVMDYYSTLKIKESDMHCTMVEPWGHYIKWAIKDKYYMIPLILGI